MSSPTTPDGPETDASPTESSAEAIVRLEAEVADLKDLSLIHI